MTLLPWLFVVGGFAVAAWRLAPFFGKQCRARYTGDDRVPVSVIIPARNEAHNLPHLLNSLAKLKPAPFEIIVVDDHSTDETAAIAKARGATVVQPPPLPPGWLGKPWACRAGAEVARGKYLLFTDADTRHASESLADAVAAMEQSGAGLLSVIPTHLVQSWWERLQGVFQLLLLIATRAARSARARDTGERAFCIGQYLLFESGTYEKIGGHEAVRHRVAEDLAFYRLVRAHGGQYLLLNKRGMLNVRMYPEGLGAFVDGWRRNFREGLDAAGVGGVLEVIVVIGWLLGLPIWLATAWFEGNGIAEAAYAGVYLATGFLITYAQRIAGNFSALGAFLFPFFTAIFVLATVLAVVDKVRQAPIRWRGRSVPSTQPYPPA